MQTTTLRARLARAAAATAVVAVGAASLIAGTDFAGADPKQFDDPLVTMGSDTTQDILDAFTGEVNGTRFIPLRSSEATGRTQVASWRAVNLVGTTPEACVEPAGGILVDRPNGSGNGRRALSAAFGLNAGQTVGWGRTDVSCTSEYASMSGLIDFSRSSSGASGTSGDLTFVPFARDALQFAYSAPDAVSAENDLPTIDVQGLHTNAGASAVLNEGTVRIIACRIQDGSGTYESWMGNMGLDPDSATDETTLETSTGECADAFDEVQSGIDGIQEHDPQGLYDACERIRNGYTAIGPDGEAGTGDDFAVAAQPTTQCIIGYSAANWVAQFNGVGSRSLDVDGAGTDAPPTAATGGAFNLGIRDGGDEAYLLAGGPLVASPNTDYYNGTFGRDVYNVVPTLNITLSGNNAMKTMLLCDGPDTGTDCDFHSEGPGSGPAICSAEAAVTRSLLGFAASFDRPCGAYGAFNKRAWDFSSTGPIGDPEI